MRLAVDTAAATLTADVLLRTNDGDLTLDAVADDGGESDNSMRLLLDYANYGNDEGMWFVLPTGNSGHILDLHYDDQVEMYLRGEYRNMRFAQDDIKAHQEYETVFTPVR